jgi:hypothetical protein
MVQHRGEQPADVRFITVACRGEVLGISAPGHVDLSVDPERM